MEIKDENNYQLEIENTNKKTYFSVIISANYLKKPSAFTRSPSCRTSKCRWLPVELPVVPT